MTKVNSSTPYTIVKIENVFYNKNGEPVPRKSQEAHIPLDEFNFNSFKLLKKASPLIESHFEYMKAEYGLSWTSLFTFLEDFANKKSILSDNQEYLLSLFGYNEVSHSIDEDRELIRKELRKKQSNIRLDEGLAFIRLCILVNMFDREMDKAPDSDEKFRQYCLSHPLWPRIEKQAYVTLELFKKNKSGRPLTPSSPSIKSII